MKSTPTAQKSQRGQMLIGMIIVIAIILAMTVYSLRPHGVIETAQERGEMTPCIAYTSQIREAIMMYKQDNGSYPPNLQALKKEGVTSEMYAPPCTYAYDPSTGTLTPPSMTPGAPAPASAPSAPAGGNGGVALSPAASPAPAAPSGGNGGVYIPPMAGTVGVHVPTGGGPSNHERGDGGE